MSNSSIWPIDRTLSGVTTLGQSGSGSDGNEGVLCILQSFSITAASSSDCLVSYPGHSLREFYPSAEMQSVYSTASPDWARKNWEIDLQSGLSQIVKRFIKKKKKKLICNSNCSYKTLNATKHQIVYSF